MDVDFFNIDRKMPNDLLCNLDVMHVCMSLYVYISLPFGGSLTNSVRR
jgi:hypothetical protein